MRRLALRILLRLLAATWRIDVVGGEHLASTRRAGGGFVFALWHRTLLPLLWWHRRQDITLLVSRHADGELLAHSATRLGYRLVRGSTTRGGAVALRAMIRTLDAGGTVAVTPDGPRGPARVVKSGVLDAARRVHAPILPVAAGASSAWELGSWDRLVIPHPFARVRIAYGPPMDPGLDHGADATSGELARRLDAVAALAALP